MNRVEKIITWCATLFVPILLFLLAPIWGSLFEEKKALEYSIVYEQKLFDRESFKDYWPEFQFNNGKSELNEAYLTTIVISNSGKAPIRTADFEAPIRFDLELEKGGIQPRVVNSHPKGLPVKIKAGERYFSIDPLLLNSGDFFHVELLTESKIKVGKAAVRIVGMDNIKEKRVTPYSGLMLELVEPGETISSTNQRHLMPITGYGLAFASLLAAFCTFVFLFAYLASESAIRFVFVALFLAMYPIALISSRFLPDAFLGASSAKWMDYMSMFGILIFGASLAFLLRNHLGEIKLKRSS